MLTPAPPKAFLTAWLLHCCDRLQFGLPDDVAGGVNVRVGRPELLVNVDCPLVGRLDARRRQADPVAVGPDAGRDEHRVAGDCALGAVDDRVYGHRRVSRVGVGAGAAVDCRPVDPLKVGAGDDVDSLLLEDPLHLAADLALHPGENAVGPLEEGHVHADTVEDLPPLQRGVAAAEDHEVVGFVFYGR
jgi:hypothetical protein